MHVLRINWREHNIRRIDASCDQKRAFVDSAIVEFAGGVVFGMPTPDKGARRAWLNWAIASACMTLAVHNGTSGDGERAVQAMRGALPKPIIDWAGPMPFPAVQSLFDGLYPKGLHWYWKGDFVKDLPDEAIETHLAHTDTIPSALSAMHLYPIDGAVHRRKRSDTAWNARDATWSMVIVGVDTDPTKFPQLRQWARDYWAAVHPFNLAGGYPNFMMDDEGRERLEATFGDNYRRLVALKKKFDPANLFHVNQNIRSTEASDGALRNVR